jgi:hypothetical protein
MEVNGAAFISGQTLMISSVGERPWRELLARVSARHPVFASEITAVTRIPIEAFLDLHQSMLIDFFKNDPKIFWTFGERSAEHAITQGPLAGMFKPGEYRRFFEFAPAIWKVYYTAGRVAVKVESDTRAEISLLDLPVKHLYLELSVMGFIAGGLRALGALNPKIEKVKSFTRGDDSVVYRITATG